MLFNAHIGSTTMSLMAIILSQLPMLNWRLLTGWNSLMCYERSTIQAHIINKNCFTPMSCILNPCTLSVTILKQDEHCTLLKYKYLSQY